MNPSKEDINEIVSILEMDVICFFHRPTGTIESFPDPDTMDFDREVWQEAIDKVNADKKNYTRFDTMDSHYGFKTMEAFALSLDDLEFRNGLNEQLSRNKPFNRFKRMVDESDYRQDWFDFKHNAYIHWVKKQID